MEETDEHLVGRAGAGDKIAFTHLVARHQRRLLALVNRSLANRAASEDVVQEVFARAWVAAPTWRPQTGSGGYAAWLSRVAVNLSIDQLRKRRPVALDGIDDPPDQAAPADHAIEARETAARVRTAVAALPERQRIAIGLTYDAELSNAEGAAALGTTVGAFELLLVRARRALRLSLQQDALQQDAVQRNETP